MKTYLKEISTSNNTSYDVCMDKHYFLIGRRVDNDLVIHIDKISRFNGIIAKHPKTNKLYLFSISRNKNLFHNAKAKNFNAYGSLVPSSIDSLTIVSVANSSNDLGEIIDRENIENIASFKPGLFRKIDQLKPLLEKLKQAKYFDFCIQQGAIKLENGCFIAMKTRSIELIYQLVIEVEYMKIEKPSLSFDNLLLSEEGT